MNVPEGMNSGHTIELKQANFQKHLRMKSYNKDDYRLMSQNTLYIAFWDQKIWQGQSYDSAGSTDLCSTVRFQDHTSNHTYRQIEDIKLKINAIHLSDALCTCFWRYNSFTKSSPDCPLLIALWQKSNSCEFCPYKTQVGRHGFRTKPLLLPPGISD